LSENAAPLRHVVTLVVVAHDGARLLPGLINGVREQTHPVHRAVGVDTGSQDRSGVVLAELLGPDAVFSMDAETGYGAAVARALQHTAARRPSSEPGSSPDPDVEWIWLLHDDCEPAPDALEQMLRAASRNRSTAVLGPKLKDLADRRVLREAGVTVDRAGRRYTGIEPGEIDQGQHDGNRPVLAVSSAGMLIRRDVWDQLGGFDPNLPLMRDDIDFCWRAHAVGYDVRVVTDAVVYHRALSARQMRKAPAAGGHPRMADRRGALYVFAANVPFGPMLVIVGGCVAGSLLRAVCFLLTKQQRRAWDHLLAVGWLLRHPILLGRARRRRAADRRHAWSLLREQLPRSRTLGRLAESAAGLLAGGPAYESGGLHHALVDEVGEDMPLPATDSVVRRVLTSPGVLLGAGLILVALVAERRLVGSVLTGSGTLSGGALVPAWGGASDLWREYLAGYHDAGVGSAASTPPYIGVLAMLATLLAGKPWLAVDVLLFGCVPAAGVTAFLATRRLTSVLAARIWLAASYALLPVAMGAVATGRLGTAVAFVLLPLIGIAVGRMLTGPPRRARRAAWATGLLVALAAAFVPLIWPIAVIGAIGLVAAWSWLGRATAVNAAIAALVPAVVLVPWTFHLFTSGSAFFLEAGIQRPGLASAGLRPESVLLLSPGGPGLPPAWVTVGLVLPAFGALLARRRLRLVCTGWAIALGGLVVALIVNRVRVTAPGGTAVSAWPGAAIAVAAVGLLLAAAPLIEAAALALGPSAAARDGRRFPAGWRGLAALAGVAVAASAPVLAAGYWLAAGVRGPVAAAGPQILPPFVASSSAAGDRTRTLVLRPDGAALSYAVLRSADPVFGEPELTESSSATHALNGVVASLAPEMGPGMGPGMGTAAGGDGGDPGQALSRFDIGYVLLPAPVDQTLARQLDGSAGLIQLTTAPAYDLWQVAGTVARARVIGADGAVTPVPSGPIGVSTVVPPATSGMLVLAEAAGGWSATLNGRPLAAVAQPVDGWAQGFVLPVGGGQLVITRNELARDLSLGIEAAAVLIVFALALPGTRSAVPVPAAEAESGPGTTPVPGRRRDRADRPRPARWQRRPQFALSLGRARGVPDPERRPEVETSAATATATVATETGAVEARATEAWATETGATEACATETGATETGATETGATETGATEIVATEAGATETEAIEAGATETVATEAGATETVATEAAHRSEPTDPSLTTAPGPAAVVAEPWTEPHVAVRPEMDASAGASSARASSAGASSAGASPAGGTSSGPPRRSRGGQHAARHGKPSRRWRRPAKPPAPAPAPVPGPSGHAVAPAGPDLDLFPGDEDADLSPWVSPDPMTTGSHAPWESGDRP
jgi:GT2 family glycosyltransferase